MAPVFSGIWGESTATIDWCEKNYEVTIYIAEFWNTVSNLVMIIISLWGTYVACKFKLEMKFILCYLFLMVVGIGSWCFHMTLLYEMQLFDELPMLWGGCMLIYTLDGIIRPPKFCNFPLMMGLILYSVIVTWAYLIIKLPLFHEIAYGLIVTVTVIMDFNLTRAKYCNLRIFIIGLIMYMGGFLLWNIDNVYCRRLTQLRLILPTVIAPVTQLHAWWHVLAGYATYMHILFCCHGRMRYLKKNYELKCSWFGLTLRKIHGKSLKA